MFTEIDLATALKRHPGQVAAIQKKLGTALDRIGYSYGLMIGDEPAPLTSGTAPTDPRSAEFLARGGAFVGFELLGTLGKKSARASLDVAALAGGPEQSWPLEIIGPDPQVRRAARAGLPTVWLFDDLSIDKLGWTEWQLAGVARATVRGKHTPWVACLVRDGDCTLLASDPKNSATLFSSGDFMRAGILRDAKITPEQQAAAERLGKAHPNYLFGHRFYDVNKEAFTQDAYPKWEWKDGRDPVAAQWVLDHTREACGRRAVNNVLTETAEATHLWMGLGQEMSEADRTRVQDFSDTARGRKGMGGVINGGQLLQMITNMQSQAATPVSPENDQRLRGMVARGMAVEEAIHFLTEVEPAQATAVAPKAPRMK